MNMTEAEWAAWPEIKMPITFKDTRFTFTNVIGKCPKCNSILTHMRGDISETGKVIEMRMGGICPECNHLVPCRSRLYVEEGIFAQERGGVWEKFRMITFNQKWRQETFKALRPMALGMGIAILFTFMGTTGPTKWTYLWWGLISVVLSSLAIWSGWMSARRR